MKTNLFCLILFLNFINFCSAQTPVIDSLSVLINKATSDTQRINLMVKKASEFSEVNIDSAINLSKQVITSAQKINYTKGEADGRLKLSRNLLFKGEYGIAITNIDAAKNSYIQLKDSFGLAAAYATLGMYYGMRSRYDTSIIYFKKTVIIAEAKHYNKMLGSTYQNLATSYQMQSNYSQALAYYKKALATAEVENDISNQAYINMNLGLTYNGVDDTIRTEQYLLQAVKLAKQAHIKNVELYAYSNLATLYGNKKRYKQGYDAAIKASNLGKETGDIGIEASALSRAAVMLANLKQFDTAEIMAQHAIKIADLSKEPLNIYQTYSDYGSVLKMQNKYSEALPFFEKAFGIIQQSDIYDNQVGQNYFDLSQCYEKTGNYQKALAAYKMSIKIADSLKSKSNIRKATELALNYEFDKKQEHVKTEQQKKDVITERIKNQQYFIIAGLGIIVLSVILIAFIQYKSSNHKKKANVVLQNTLSDLKATQQQLIQSEKMASLGELTAGIAHEIQNPLNFVNNFSEINKELISELVDEVDKKNFDEVKLIANDIKGNEEKINHHGRRADAIVKGMLQHSRQTSGTKELTDINALCDEYLRLSYHGLRAKDKSFNADFKTDFDESIGKINIVPQDIGRVLLNLFNNAFYAVKPLIRRGGEEYKPLVSVRTRKVNLANNNAVTSTPSGDGSMGIEIVVSDNGNGIPSNIIDKIFQPFFTTKPTGQGTGLGLSLAYDIITKQHNGTIKAESKEGEGTTFIIHLPIS